MVIEDNVTMINFYEHLFWVVCNPSNTLPEKKIIMALLHLDKQFVSGDY